MTDQPKFSNDAVESARPQHLSRRRFIMAPSTGLAGVVVAGSAAAETLADVPPREPGADLGAHSERSKFVKLGRIPEAGPGKRNVDPCNQLQGAARQAGR